MFVHIFSMFAILEILLTPRKIIRFCILVSSYSLLFFSNSYFWIYQNMNPISADIINFGLTILITLIFYIVCLKICKRTKIVHLIMLILVCTFISITIMSVLAIVKISNKFLPMGTLFIFI